MDHLTGSALLPLVTHIYAGARSGVDHRGVSVTTLVQDRHPFKGRRWICV